MNPFRRDPQNYHRQSVLAAVPAVNGSDGSVTMRLYDPIDSYGGDWGVSAKEFTAALDALPADTKEIRLLVNSPGGEVWEALALMNALRAHPARTVAVVEGIAASSASFIVASADEVQMMPNAEMFVHKAWGLGIGNADDFTKLSADLSHEDRNIASVYAAKAGGSVDDWMAAMSAETWYSAEEAVTAGLADKVIATPKRDDGKGAKARAFDRFDLSVFAYAGRAEAPAPHIPLAASAASVNPPAAAASGDTTQEGTAVADITDEQLTTLRQTAGVADDADVNTCLAALSEALEERADDTSGAATNRVPEGMVLMDATVQQSLVAEAAAGRADREQRQQENRAQTVNAAVRDGRIAPARRQHWLDALAADPGAEETLKGLTPGLVPVNEIGHAHDIDSTSEDDKVYSSMWPSSVTTKEA